MTVAEKFCPKCEVLKSAEFFSKNRRRSDGLQSECKACYKEYRDENKDVINAHNRQQRADNLEEHLAREAAQREVHKTKRHAYINQWRKDNPEKVREIRRRMREKKLLTEKAS